jgi:hypothetical protein
MVPSWIQNRMRAIRSLAYWDRINHAETSHVRFFLISIEYEDFTLAIFENRTSDPVNYHVLQ